MRPGRPLRLEGKSFVKDSRRERAEVIPRTEARRWVEYTTC